MIKLTIHACAVAIILVPWTPLKFVLPIGLLLLALLFVDHTRRQSPTFIAPSTQLEDDLAQGDVILRERFFPLSGQHVTSQSEFEDILRRQKCTIVRFACKEYMIERGSSPKASEPANRADQTSTSNETRTPRQPAPKMA